MLTPGQVRLPDGSLLPLLERLGQGGEGVVWSTPQPGLVCKLLHEPERAAARIVARCATASGRWRAQRDGHVWVRWPEEPVREVDSDEVVGYTIAASADSALGLEWAQGRAAREVAGLDVSWQWLLRAALHLATACWWAEDAGYAAIDLHGDNALVDRRTALVTLADNDGVRDAPGTAGAMHASITPPELLGGHEADRPASAAPALAAARWALAVTVCRLLLDGEHPFLGRHPDYDGSIDTTTWNVRNGHCRLTGDATRGALSGAVPIDVLPPGVADLAGRCFGAGAEQPDLRPSAAAWTEALAIADGEVVRCAHRRSHRHHPATGGCPWCRLREADPFSRPAGRVPA